MDYYSILGVGRNASQDEIKRAYRELAMKHHPDRPDGDAEKIKAINEAYETLKDPIKRKNYDNPEPQYQYRYDTQNPFGQGFENIFSQAFGFGQPNMRRRVRNHDITLSYTINFLDMFTGKEVNISYKMPNGRPEYLDVRIPPGIRHGDVINFAGYGDDTIPNIPRGNLILKIKVTSHPTWKRTEDNLSTTEKVNVLDLILGTAIEITTPTNKLLSLAIPKGTKPGTTFSIAGHGVPNVNSGRPGNLYIKIEAIIPNVSDKKLLEKIKEIKDAIDYSTE